MRRAYGVTLLVALLFMGMTPFQVMSQEAPDTAAMPGGYRATAWSTHPHGTVVAMVLRIPAGSANDEKGSEGTAALLAQTLRDQARRALGPGHGAVTATVNRGTTLFTFLVLPEVWPRAATLLDSVLYDAPIDDSILDRHRRGQMARLAFESDSPGTEFEAEAARLLAPSGSPWARPVRGTPESVSALSPAILARFRRSLYRRAETARAVVGPRSLLPTSTVALPLPVDSVLADTIPVAVADSQAVRDTVPAPVAALPPEPRVASDTAPGLAWSSGTRVDQVQDVTSTWIRVAYPIARSTSRTAAEMLVTLVHDELDPTPPDPDRYGVQVRLLDVPGGTALVVDATVFPEAAGRWEDKITGTISRLASGPMQPDLFGWRRRRFRTERLLEEASPELEAERMTGDLIGTGRARDLAVEIWSLDAGTVYQAAKELGPPRILRFGPDLGEAHAPVSPDRSGFSRAVPRSLRGYTLTGRTEVARPSSGF
ncbi:MAG: hypothetical protein LJF04_05655 [Gemmatimonadetes bacterium]|nr:hypothetical protein [Gemmatimonadota bacterium]